MDYNRFSEREKQILQSVVYLLKEDLHPEKIILFGSRAKGNNRKHSDFDFAVETNKPDGRIKRNLFERIEKISGLYKVDIVFLNDVDSTFRDIILSNGKVLYAK